MSFKTCKTTRTFVRDFLSALDCPRSLMVWLLFDSNEHDQLSKLSWNPSDYNSLSDARDSLSASKILSKADFLETSFDREKIAMEGFWSAETQCRIANRRIASRTFENKSTDAILHRMSGLIARFLGDFDAEEFVESCGWGPGATLAVKASMCTQPKKFDAERQTTAEALTFFGPWISSAYPLWWGEADCFSVVPGNKVITVPKNAKTDRVIAIEPGMNSWFQKGIGSMIRRRLRRNGIDLNHQSHNQQRAWEGSKFDSLATVDFSAASDTVSKAIVEEVIPGDWLTLMRAFRSSYGEINGSLHRYEKFSSMGNGYTFELESLIFYALALATCEHVGVDTSRVSVYGDDVIIPVEAYDAYCSFSKDLGFTVNVEKSYSSTPFRESCGSFYWSGYDIKPIYLKGKLDDHRKTLRAANMVRILAHRRASRLGCDRNLLPCWKRLVGGLGEKTPYVPHTSGDIGIIGNLSEAFDSRYPPRRAKCGFEGFRVRALIDRPAILETDSLGLLLFRLKQIGTAELEYRNTVPMPRRTVERLSTIHVPLWEDLGDWF